MNMQGNALQSQLKAFTVLQPVVLELNSTFLGPGLGQGAALYTPAGLNETITLRVSREHEILLAVCVGFSAPSSAFCEMQH